MTFGTCGFRLTYQEIFWSILVENKLATPALEYPGHSGNYPLTSPK